MGVRWPSKSIDELKAPTNGAIAIGPFGSRMKSDCYVASGVEVIRGTNISETRALIGEMVCITPQLADQLGNAIVHADDLVFPHRGSIGLVGIVPRNGSERYALSSSLMKLTCDRKQVDPLFLFYFFRSDEGRHELLKNASTVGTPGIGQPLSSLRSVKVPLPPLAEQKAIAEVLGALDDKIELNRRMNATLEAMARALFTNWNEVHPHEFVEYTVQELIDDGTLLIGDGYRAKNVEMADVGLPFIRAGNLKSDGLDLHGAELLGTKSLAKAGNKIGRAGEVAFTSKGTVGRITRVSSRTGAFVYSQQVCFWRSVAPEKLNPHVLYRSMGTDSYMSQVAAVCTQTDMAPCVSLKDQRRMLIRLPESAAQREIAEHLEPIDDCIAANAEQSRALAVLRDTLLPKLLSGEVQASAGLCESTRQYDHSSTF
jgi:type I restriction enzyme, S subunit